MRLCAALAATALVTTGLVGWTAPSSAQQAQEGVLLLVDVSGSMADDDGTGTIKLDGARN